MYNPADYYVHTLAVVPGREEQSLKTIKVKRINEIEAYMQGKLALSLLKLTFGALFLFLDHL